MSELVWNTFAIIGAAQTIVFTGAALAIAVMVLKPLPKVAPTSTEQGVADAATAT